MKSFDALMVEVDDARAQMDSLGKKLQREEEASAVQMEIIIGHRAEIRDLEALVQLATQPQKAVPREPDIVILTSDQPGVSGGLASVQEACSWISERGTNRGHPCIRPAEPNQKHAKGRHRYS